MWQLLAFRAQIQKLLCLTRAKSVLNSHKYNQTCNLQDFWQKELRLKGFYNFIRGISIIYELYSAKLSMVPHCMVLNCPVPNFLVSNCPRCQIVLCLIVLCKIVLGAFSWSARLCFKIFCQDLCTFPNYFWTERQTSPTVLLFWCIDFSCIDFAVVILREIF